MNKQVLQKPDSSNDYMDVCYNFQNQCLIFRVRAKIIGAYAELVSAYADSMPEATRPHEGGTLCESMRKDAVETYLGWVEDEMFYDEQRRQELIHQFEMLDERDFNY